MNQLFEHQIVPQDQEPFYAEEDSIQDYPEHKLFLVGRAPHYLLCSVHRVTANAPRQLVRRCERNCVLPPPYLEGLQGYWAKRYLYFRRYDEGVLIDRESFYSVTPQAVAEFMAAQLPQLPKLGKILDAFCGVGGDALKMAGKCQRVVCNDIDYEKLVCLHINSMVHDVVNLEPSLGDFLNIDQTLQFDAVFLAPPWGGVSYQQQSSMRCEDFFPSLRLIMEKACRLSDGNMIFLLPFNMHLNSWLGELAECLEKYQPVKAHRTIRLTKIYYNYRFKFIGAWVGSRVQRWLSADEAVKWACRRITDSEDDFAVKQVVKNLSNDIGVGKVLALAERLQGKGKATFLQQYGPNSATIISGKIEGAEMASQVQIIKVTNMFDLKNQKSPQNQRQQ